jgi:TRAP-type mannitol/chloroaromatic compound transport system permease small subunit
MLAGPYALARNGHVRGDFLYRTWPPQRQATFDLVLYILFFFPGILALAYAGYGFAAFSWLIKEHSSNSPNGPPLYHFKSLIPIVGVMMVVQGLAEVARCVICIRTGEWPQRLSDVEELERTILAEAESAGMTKGDI